MRRRGRRANKGGSGSTFNLLTAPGVFDVFDPATIVTTPSFSWPSSTTSGSIFTHVAGGTPAVLPARINGLNVLQFVSSSSDRVDVFRNWGMSGGSEFTFIAVLSITGFGSGTPAYILGSNDTSTNTAAFNLALDNNGLGHPTLRRNTSGAIGVEWLVDLVGAGYQIITGRASIDGTNEIFINGISHGTFSDSTAPCKNTLTLGANGAAAIEYSDFELAYLMTFNQRLSGDTMNAVHAALRTKFALTAPNPQVNIRGYGHSIVAGSDATRIGTTDFMSRLEHSLDPFTFTMSHLGRSGFDTSQLLPDAAMDVDAFLVPGKLNVFLYMEMVNSIDHKNGAGQSDAQIIANTVSDIKSMFAARIAAGWNKCIYVNQYYPIYYDGTPHLMNDVDQITAQLKAYSGIDATVDIWGDPEINKFPGDTRIISSTDNLHPTDYGHQCIYDLALKTILASYTAWTGVTIPFDPQQLPRMAMRYEANPNKILFDNGNNVGTIQDKSSWAYDFTATGAARPVWNAANRSIDAAGAALMSTALSLAITYATKIEVFAQFSITSNSTIIFEMSGIYTGVQDSFAILSTASAGPEIAENGNVGSSNATASAVAGMQQWSMILDNTVSSNQGNILLAGATAPGLAHVDAPNTNAYGSRGCFLFGRSGGTLESTMSLRRLFIFTTPLTTAQRAQLLAWAT